MTHEKIDVNVGSEFGELEAVIIHSPGSEVERVTPQNAERALYSDILNLSIVKKEYAQFKAVLDLHTKTFEVSELLEDILQDEGVKDLLLSKICTNESVYQQKKDLLNQSPGELAKNLIEGVELRKSNLTNYLSSERYSLSPLHNFFFMRDASVTINDTVFISRMANIVREREAIIMEAIFNHHPQLTSKTYNPSNRINFDPQVTVEGGDIIVAREDTLIIGKSLRTTSQGIDYILEKVKEDGKIKNIIVQELPASPESFIHLDMAFTFLSQNEVMIYEPVILNPNQFKTILIKIENGQVNISEKRDIMETLREINIEVEPVLCGGKTDAWIQEREQWHSGANLFAMGPGKLLAYARNTNTLEELNKRGYEVIKANEVIKKKKDYKSFDKYVITIDSSELSRGGGGCRCMTMPIKRKAIS